MASDVSTAPQAFQNALRTLQGARTRRDVRLTETAAPVRIAPYAVAIDGEIAQPHAEASGRFVLLHDPAGQPAWEGTFRIVALVKSAVEAEVGSDDMWADVAWSWFADALEGVPHHSRSGTVTKVVSRSFGEIAHGDGRVDVEIRASWTPDTDDMEPHVIAWANLMASCAGVPPLPDGVTMLRGTSA